MKPVRKYVVGFHGYNQCVYGKADTPKMLSYTDRMTIREAEKMLLELGPGRKEIYALVPVKRWRVAKGKRSKR